MKNKIFNSLKIILPSVGVVSLLAVFYIYFFIQIDTFYSVFEEKYEYNDIIEIDDFDSADGYVAYLPKDFELDSIHVIVFNHGWGAHDPMAYGAWIKHLVFQGYAVIFPRYQKSILTWPADFTANAATGINEALKAIEHKHGIIPITDRLILAGHSFGGVISVNLATEWTTFEIPKPAAVFAIQPGHGPFYSGRIGDYSHFPEDIQMIFIVSEHDRITGDKFAREFFELNYGRIHEMNLLTMFKDRHENEVIKATHDDPLAMDMDMKKGTAFWIPLIGRLKNEINQADFYGFWRLLDALADCNFYGKNCDEAIGGTDAQTFMGYWNDGTPIRPLKVEL